MTNQLPTRMDVRYERAKSYDIKKVPDAIWSYSIENADSNVSGFAGGLLVRQDDGQWVAHYWERAHGAPAKTREQAILNVLPAAKAIVDEYHVRQANYESTYQTRCEAGSKMRELFPSECGLVTVRDCTAERDKPSPEARFKVVFQFDNLTEEQVISLAVRFQSR